MGDGVPALGAHVRRAWRVAHPSWSPRGLKRAVPPPLYGDARIRPLVALPPERREHDIHFQVVRECDGVRRVWCACVCVCVCVNVPLFDSHFLLRRLIPSGSPPSLSGGDAGAHRTPEPPTPEALRGLLRSLLPSAPPPEVAPVRRSPLRRRSGVLLRSLSPSGPPRRWRRSPPHSGAPPPKDLRR